MLAVRLKNVMVILTIRLVILMYSFVCWPNLYVLILEGLDNIHSYFTISVLNATNLKFESKVYKSRI